MQAVSCVSALESAGSHQCALSASDSLALYGNDSHAGLRPEECDLVISLGGDGAVLRAAQTAIRAGKPLFGINSGRLGYLCAMPFEQIGRFDEILNECRISARGILSVTIGDRVIPAVNDLVIAKQRFGETVEMTVRIDEEEPFRLRGDGLIIATPTGSTAYNYSAGGPVLEPTVSAIALTPICSHEQMTHTNVIGASHCITVMARADKGAIYADGNAVGDMAEPVTARYIPDALQLYVRHEPVCMMGGFMSRK